MKHIIAFVCMLGLLLFSSCSEYLDYLSEPIEITKDTVFTRAMNPLEIRNNIIIRDGVRLLIEPGCSIFVYGNHQLTVYGSITAIGTDSLPIHYTTLTTDENDYRFIRIKSIGKSVVNELKNIVFRGKIDILVNDTKQAIITANYFDSLDTFSSLNSNVTFNNNIVQCNSIASISLKNNELVSVQNNAFILNDYTRFSLVDSNNQNSSFSNNLIIGKTPRDKADFSQYFNQENISYNAFSVALINNTTDGNGKTIGTFGADSIDTQFNIYRSAILNQDFSLPENSPLRNAGDPRSEFNDLDGSRNDIGPYGGKTPFNSRILSNANLQHW